MVYMKARPSGCALTAHLVYLRYLIVAIFGAIDFVRPCCIIQCSSGGVTAKLYKLLHLSTSANNTTAPDRLPSHPFCACRSACLCRPRHRMANRHWLSPDTHGNSRDSQVPAQAKQQLAIVFSKLYGNAILDPIEVGSLDTGQQIFRDLKRRYLKLLRSESRTYWLRLLFLRMEVDIAEIRWVSPRYFREWKTHKLTCA